MLAFPKPAGTLRSWQCISLLHEQNATRTLSTGLVPTALRDRRRQTLPRVDAVWGRRYKIIESGEGKTGHIDTKQNEGIFFVDSTHSKAQESFAYAHEAQTCFHSRASAFSAFPSEH